jgi:hypothetical protein
MFLCSLANALDSYDLRHRLRMPGEEDLSGRGNAEEAAALRERVLLMLAAFEREESSPTWPQLRKVVEASTRLSDLRTVLRECRGMMGAMSPAARRTLERDLRNRFGADSEWQRDVAIVAKVRARGRIRSEREYRTVQAYQDSIAGDLEHQDEFLTLGALLDEFSAAR